MVLGLGNSITSLYTPGETAYTASASWDFDGLNDYINLGNSSNLKVTATDTSEGGGLTVSMWVKNDTWAYASSVQTPVSAYHSATGGKGWQTYFYSTSFKVVLDIAGGADPNSLITGWRGFAAADGSSGSPARPLWRESGWHHISFTFDGRYFYFYVDGQLSASGSNTTDIGSDNNVMKYGSGSGNVDVMIGAEPNVLNSPDGGATWTPGTSVANQYWSGLINEVAIWDKALDVDAMKEIFDAVDVDGSVLDLTKDSGDYDYSGDLIGLWRPSDGIDGTTATNIANPGTHDGSIKNSLGTSSEVPT